MIQIKGTPTDKYVSIFPLISSTVSLGERISTGKRVKVAHALPPLPKRERGVAWDSWDG
jgi:hypothetical protein